MSKREEFIKTLNHKTPKHVVVDLGATGQTGINASSLYKLRKALDLQEKPIKIIEPFQMLGEVEEDVLQVLGCHIKGIFNRGNMFGTQNLEYKPFTMPDGTPTLIAKDIQYFKDAKGDFFVYPCADTSLEPCAHMTYDGSFFDNIERCRDYDGDLLNGVKDFKDDFSVVTQEDARHWENTSKALYENTDYGLVGVLGGGGLGDVATIPGPYIKKPKGIRTVEEWMLAHALYPNYIKEVFAYQTEIMLKNLEIYKQAVGDRIQVVWVSGTDFGTQISTFISPTQFRELYKPFYTKINGWIHKNTDWKTFFHTCGAIYDILDDLHEMGVDCLNPVQCSATGMEPERLKKEYGEKFIFWGGVADTQNTLPFGNVETVKKEVKHRLDIFSKNGGFVCSAIHNIVANVPSQNIIALFEAIREFGL